MRLDADNDEAYSMLARAYWDKGAWRAGDRDRRQGDRDHAVERAGAPVARRRAAASWPRRRRTQPRQVQLYAMRATTTATFLDLTNFSTGLGSKLAFHFIGLGVGSRRHADRQGAYDSLRSAGFLGLCLSEQKVGNPLKAREYCQRALQHAPKDPIAHFLLGNVNRDLYNVRPSCDVPEGRASTAT